MLFALLASLLAAPTLPDAALQSCLGTTHVAFDRVAITQAKASAGDEAWWKACREARDADVRRLRLTSEVLAGSVEPKPFASATKYVRAAAADTPLKVALFQNVARDQAARSANTLAAKTLYADGLTPLSESLLVGLISFDAVVADQQNQRWLAGVLLQRGWFTISADGETADSAAWLIAQHSDGDPIFQHYLIDVLEPLARTGETSRNRFAFLYDRWAVSTGAPQRYALNGKCVTAGRWEPGPTEDMGHVDERRSAAGLPSLKQWAEEHSAHCR